MKMKLSKYTVFYEVAEDLGVMFNTFNGSVIQLRRSAYESLKEEFEWKEIEKIFGEYSAMVKEKFCTVGDRDKELLDEKLKQGQFNKDRLTVTILTTQACNLSCVYCYQQGLIDRSLHLQPNVAERIKQWVIEKIYSNKPKIIVFHFYGGEPLLNIDILDGIMPEIMQAADSVGAKFTSYITTNGILLGEENIRKLKKWKLDNAQISVDGPQEIHDQRRPYHDGRGSYNLIMEKLELHCALDYM